MLSETDILIPAYSEEERVGGVLHEVRAHLPNAKILVVNDGSSDKTAKVCVEAGALVLTKGADRFRTPEYLE